MEQLGRVLRVKEIFKRLDWILHNDLYHAKRCIKFHKTCKTGQYWPDDITYSKAQANTMYRKLLKEQKALKEELLNLIP